jgi:hypothetical protein
MICAGNSRRNACEGDSGGPLLKYNHEKDQNATTIGVQIGIISFGPPFECGKESLPISVHSKVLPIMPWIEQIVDGVELVSSTSKIVSLNDIVEFNCYYRHIETRIHWTKDDKKIAVGANGQFQIFYNGRKLVIDGNNWKASGNYRCHVQITEGTVYSKYFNLIVKGSVLITPKGRWHVVDLTRHHAFQFHCTSAIGRPVVWKHNGKELTKVCTTNDDIQVCNSTVQIFHFRPEFAGEYTCEDKLTKDFDSIDLGGNHFECMIMYNLN